MSYQPYAAPPLPPSDPTDVVGKRVLAWIIDGIIYVALSMVLRLAIGGNGGIESHDLNNSQQTPEAFCRLWRQAHNGFCSYSGSTASTFTWDDIARALIPFFVLFIIYCIVQGLLGGSLGKLAMGLRIVKADGTQAGIGASFIRTIMWIVDAITCAIPLVGLITMMTTKGHRRVGDMAASTYVVRQQHVGQPVILPGDPGYGYYGFSGQHGVYTGQPGAAPFGQPGQAPYGQPGAELFGQPGQAPYGQPGQPGAAPTGPPGQPVQPTTSGPSATDGAYEADKPVWDDARDTYIQFDSERNAWLEFDQKSQSWKPIST